MSSRLVVVRTPPRFIRLWAENPARVTRERGMRKQSGGDDAVITHPADWGFHCQMWNPSADPLVVWRITLVLNELCGAPVCFRGYGIWSASCRTLANGDGNKSPDRASNPAGFEGPSPCVSMVTRCLRLKRWGWGHLCVTNNCRFQVGIGLTNGCSGLRWISRGRSFESISELTRWHAGVATEGRKKLKKKGIPHHLGVSQMRQVSGDFVHNISAHIQIVKPFVSLKGTAWNLTNIIKVPL